MREVIEENLNNKTDTKKNFDKSSLQNEDIISEPDQIENNVSELEVNKTQNELDDDLLQIPAFLRRQAN